MADPEAILAAVRMTEREPSLLGSSAHVLGIATNPATNPARPAQS